MDLTEAQWALVEKYFPRRELRPPMKKGGRPWRSAREVLNGVLWVLRTGAPWADLPRRYPPYQTCHRRFQRWVENKTLPKILAGLRRDLETRGGIEDVEAYIDGTYVPAKKGGISLVVAELEMPRRSWRSQTAAVFQSLSILQRGTDTTVCSPSELSTLLSWPNYLRD